MRRYKRFLNIPLGEVKYTRLAHIVNIAFIMTTFLGPLLASIYTDTLGEMSSTSIIFTSFLVTTWITVDWYGYHFSNTWSGIFTIILIGVTLPVSIALIIYVISDATFVDVILMRDPSARDGVWKLFGRFYAAGLLAMASVVVCIPRLLLIQLVAQKDLPKESNSIFSW